MGGCCAVYWQRKPMYSIITKEQYFAALEPALPPVFDRMKGDLKHIQDAVVWSLVRDTKKSDVIEAGGGVTRILRVLDQSNRMLNVDEFLGNDGGPGHVDNPPGVKVHRSKIGDMNLPADSCDLLFSVSVIEHIPWGQPLENFFKDCFRVLRPGGRMVHAIDVYLHTSPDPIGIEEVDKYTIYAKKRIAKYLDLVEQAGFVLTKDTTIDIDGDLTFRSEYATNSDLRMLMWDQWGTQLSTLRRHAQSCSLILEAKKPGKKSRFRRLGS